MYLHVTMQKSVRAGLEFLGNPESVLVMEDCFSFGPLLPIGNPQESLARIEYWHSLSKTILPKFDYSRPSLPDLKRLCLSKQILIWVGPSLDEQLFFAWFVATLRCIGIMHYNVYVINIGEDYATGKAISSLSMLSTAGAKAALIHGRHLLTSVEFESISNLWLALTEASPDRFIRLLEHRNSSSLLIATIQERLELLLQRYPSIKNGLNMIDNHVLRYCNEFGPRAVPVVAQYIFDHQDDYDRVGDVTFHLRILSLASRKLKYPLLEIDGDPNKIRSFSAKLTNAGHAVLAEEANCVKLNGINDWIGGVHLEFPPGPIWYYVSQTDGLVAG